MRRVGSNRCLQLLFASEAPFSLQLIGVAAILNEPTISGTAPFCAAYGFPIYVSDIFYPCEQSPDMDDADTWSYATDDIDPELLASPRSMVSEHTVAYAGAEDEIDETVTPTGRATDGDGAACPAMLYGVALRAEVLQQLQRLPSAVLDDGQLAVYIQFRGVALPAVVEWGIFYYLEQHAPEYDLYRREITQQLQTTVASMDHLDILTFFRHMLDGEYLESFYAAVYQLVIDRINTAERVSYFADVLHMLPVSDAEDAHTPTEPDPDSNSERSSGPAPDTTPATVHVIDVLDDSESAD